MAYGDFKEVSHIASFIKPSSHKGVLTKREWKKSQKSTQVDTRKEYKEKLAFKELTSPPKPEGASKPKNYRQYKKERIGTYKEYVGDLSSSSEHGISQKGRLAQLTSGWKNPFRKSHGYKQTGKKWWQKSSGKTIGTFTQESGNCIAGQCTP